jgi:hypothetical protein
MTSSHLTFMIAKPLIRPASVACLFDIVDRARMFDRKVNFLFASFDVFPR